jgi:hypothetical protein
VLKLKKNAFNKKSKNKKKMEVICLGYGTTITIKKIKQILRDPEKL